MTNKTIQIGNTADGDIAGGNITKTYYNYAAKTYISRLTEEFKKEQLNDSSSQETIEELEHFKARLNTQIIGLEEKLKLGGRENEIDRAAECKERFAKKMAKHQMSTSAQKMFAYILSDIKTRFTRIVIPLIKSNAPSGDVDSDWREI